MRHSSPARQLSLTVVSIASAEEAGTNGVKSLNIYLDSDDTGKDEARFLSGKNRQW
jgi:hypothetical protein